MGVLTSQPQSPQLGIVRQAALKCSCLGRGSSSGTRVTAPTTRTMGKVQIYNKFRKSRQIYSSSDGIWYLVSSILQQAQSFLRFLKGTVLRARGPPVPLRWICLWRSRRRDTTRSRTLMFFMFFNKVELIFVFCQNSFWINSLSSQKIYASQKSCSNFEYFKNVCIFISLL